MIKSTVIKTGGKQYLVQPGQEITIEKIKGKPKDKVIFDQVLLCVDNKKTAFIGQPLIKGAQVKAQIIEQGRGKKKIVFKYKAKKRYKKKKGHRQDYTKVKILEIRA